MLEITLNGTKKLLPGPLSVADLIEQLGFDPRRVAIEVNREIVPRSLHAEKPLAAGDAVEIVTLVGGGSGERWA